MKLLITLLLALSATSARAHRDTVIELDADGSMSALPRQYQHARLDVLHDSRGGVRRATLTLSGRTVEFPPCIARLFAVPSGQRIAGLASWYHRPRDPADDVLPPYLVLHLRTGPVGDPWHGEGHSIMFDLRTAEIAEIVERRLSPDSTPAVQSIEGKTIPPASICSADELRRLKVRPLFDKAR